MNPLKDDATLMNYERAPYLIAQALRARGWRNIYIMIAFNWLVIGLAINWPITAAIGALCFILLSIYYHRRFRELKMQLIRLPPLYQERDAALSAARGHVETVQ
jgi:hypothetical protein